MAIRNTLAHVRNEHKWFAQIIGIGFKLSDINIYIVYVIECVYILINDVMSTEFNTT
jgi:hypothetical protein